MHLLYLCNPKSPSTTVCRYYCLTVQEFSYIGSKEEVQGQHCHRLLADLK